MNELLKTLCALNGVSGDEDAGAGVPARNRPEPWADGLSHATPWAT